MQHMEALGRNIPLGWHETQTGESITVPLSASYQVRDVYPYYYTLHLRNGFTLPVRASAREDEIIGYFEASPRYPWWYIVDVIGLRNSEVIVLYESYAAFAKPREAIDGISWAAHSSQPPTKDVRQGRVPPDKPRR
jgi:hypothetical protein